MTLLTSTGYLATVFGGKQVLLTSMLLASVLTGVTPMLAERGLSYLVAVRAILGFFRCAMHRRDYTTRS